MNKRDSKTPAGGCPFSHGGVGQEGQSPGGGPGQMAGLQESEAKYAGIIESAMDAIITIDDKQTIVLFNKAAERMFRSSKGDAIGKPLSIFIPERFREVHRHHVENFDHSQVADRAMGRQKALLALRADGEEFPIEASISQAQVGGSKHFTAIIRDISERVRVQRLLSELEARYRTIFEHAGLGIAMIDEKENLIDANPACETLLSYSRGELRQQSLGTLVHPKDVKALKFRQLLNGQQNTESLEVEIRFITKDKRRVWTRVVYTAVRNALSYPVYFVAIIEDITQKKHAQRRLKRLREKHKTTINRLMLLTKRELEVLWLMVDGNPTKIMAAELGISQKTIDVHRGRVMEKMRAESLAKLVQSVIPIRKNLHVLTETK